MVARRAPPAAAAMAGRERPPPDPTAGFVCPGTEFLRQATNYEEIGLIGNGQSMAGQGCVLGRGRQVW